MDEMQRYEFQLWWERMGLRGTCALARVYEDYRLWAKMYGPASQAAFVRALRDVGVRVGSASKLVFLPSLEEMGPSPSGYPGKRV